MFMLICDINCIYQLVIMLLMIDLQIIILTPSKPTTCIHVIFSEKMFIFMGFFH